MVFCGFKCMPCGHKSSHISHIVWWVSEKCKSLVHTKQLFYLSSSYPSFCLLFFHLFFFLTSSLHCQCLANKNVCSVIDRGTAFQITLPTSLQTIEIFCHLVCYTDLAKTKKCTEGVLMYLWQRCRVLFLLLCSKLIFQLHLEWSVMFYILLHVCHWIMSWKKDGLLRLVTDHHSQLYG